MLVKKSTFSKEQLRLALEHNRRVNDSGEGELAEVRETDLSVKAAKQRYMLFVDGTMAANEALKRSFPYNLINASGTVAEVKPLGVLAMIDDGELDWKVRQLHAESLQQ